VIDIAIRPGAVTGAPAPGPKATPPERAKAPAPAAHPFAELLRQNRLAAATPASAASAEAPSSSAPAGDSPAASADAKASSDAVPADPAPPQRDAMQAKARLAGASRAAPDAQAQVPDAPSSTDPAAAETPARPGDAKDAVPTPPDASLLAGAVASARPEVTQKLEADAAGAGAAAAGKAASAGPFLRSGAAASDGQAAFGLPFDAGSAPEAAAATATGRSAAIAAGDASPGGDAGAAPSIEASIGASFAGALAEAKGSHAAPASSVLERPNNDAAMPVGQAVGFTGNVAADAPGAGAAPTLPTPVHSPEFATAFGMQVSVLAKNGVQQAELHLNPAEMGPVSIQITLDGTQARVDFGADMAATRHAIEAGLPELASALRDAGFTLAGGGVAQHSASNGGDADANRGPASSASAQPVPSADAATQRLTRRVAAGGVDTYA
jgi:flagellar hook-length control protein FliK